jgi:ABC-2 type transport system permease protein
MIDLLKLVKGEFFKFFKGTAVRVFAIVLSAIIVIMAFVYNPETINIEAMLSSGFWRGDNTHYNDWVNLPFSELARELNVIITQDFNDDLDEMFSHDGSRDIFLQPPNLYFRDTINPITTTLGYNQELLRDQFGFPDDLAYFAATNPDFFRLLLSDQDQSIDQNTLLTNTFRNSESPEEIRETLQNYGSILFDPALISFLLFSERTVVNITSITENTDAILQLFQEVYTRTDVDFFALILYIYAIHPVHFALYHQNVGDIFWEVGELMTIYTVLDQIRQNGFNTTILDASLLFLERANDILYDLYNEWLVHDRDEFLAKPYEEQKKYNEELIQKMMMFQSAVNSLWTLTHAGFNSVGYMYFPTGTIFQPSEFRIMRAEMTVIRQNLSRFFSDVQRGGNEIIFYTDAVFEQLHVITQAGGIFQNTTIMGNDTPLNIKFPVVFDALDISLTATVTESIFNDNFAFLMERIENHVETALRSLTPELYTRLYNAHFQFLSEELQERFFDAIHNDFNNFREFARETRLVRDESAMIRQYTRFTNLTLVIDEHNLTDAGLNNIYGMINVAGVFGVTKYSLRSDLARLRFEFEHSGELDVVTPFGLDNGFGFMIFTFNILFFFIIVIGVVMAGQALAGEHSQGTIKLLLIRPFKRWKILTAKIIKIISTLALIFTVTFFILYILGGLMYGFSSRDALVIFDANHVMIMSPLAVMAYMFLFYFIETAIFIMIAIMISTIFRSTAGSVAATLMVFFASFVFHFLLSSYSWYKYVIFNNTSLFVYMSTGPTLNDMTLGFSIITNLVYLALITFTTFFVFKKKDAA